MKKSILAIAVIAITVISCGPSAEEKAAEQKRIDDSVAAAEATIQAAEEAAMAAAAADSAAMASDSTKADSTAAK